MSTHVVDDTELVELLTGWLPEQRWFAGKGATVDAVQILARTPLSRSPELALDHVLLRVDAGGRQAVYQVPVSHVDEVPAALAGAVIGHPAAGTATPCDALRDPRAAALVARMLVDDAEVGPLRFTGGPGVVDPEGRARTMAVEQSNTTVVHDDAVLVKWFRQVPRGINPDVELHEALARVHCPAVAELRGNIATSTGAADGSATAAEEPDDTVTLAMVQEFLPGSADGWSMATASVRDLIAEADLLAEDVGTDFADEAGRLGESVARVHADLATALGTDTVDGARVAESLLARLETASVAAPELAEVAGAARERLGRVAELGPIPVQRVHGDLHLGQCLRAQERWVLIDFEGEPSAPLPERRRPDSPLRDVAGMLRSLDYAAGHVLVSGPTDRQRLFRSREWAERNIAAFCAGYAEVSGLDPRAHAELLEAYLLDKALYEVGYETRNRPGWVSLPRAAVDRLLGR